jgi:WD40 repeat protein
MWPLVQPQPIVIHRHTMKVLAVAFGPEGRWLASSAWDGTVRLWPLEGPVPEPGRMLVKEGRLCTNLKPTADGTEVLTGCVPYGSAELVSTAGNGTRTLEGFTRGANGIAISHDGRLAAATSGGLEMSENLIRIWDLASGEELRTLGAEEVVVPNDLGFTADGHLLSAIVDGGLVRWDLDTSEAELLYGGFVGSFVVSADGRHALFNEVEAPFGGAASWAVALDLETGASRVLEERGRRVNGGSLALDATGTVAVTAAGDVVQVGPVAGGEPHLLLGHDRGVTAAAIDPLGRWIATGGNDETVRLWPMPDLSKPPLHTLPRPELIAKLKTLTNLRVVRDEESSTGWKVAYDPFPGWETVPTW